LKGDAGTRIAFFCVLRDLCLSAAVNGKTVRAVSMNILCLGAGAVGGFFAGRLAEVAAADVTFLVRDTRKAQLLTHGLCVDSPAGDIRIPVRAITRAEIAGPSDFVLLTCKAYDLDGAIDTIRPAVARQTAVLPLLNGLSHMERLNKEFGPERVLGGIAKISSTLLPDGTIKHLNDWNSITFGEQDGAMSTRVQALKAAFDKTSAKAEAVHNVTHLMWEKLVHLASLASMTCLMRANVGEIARSPGGIKAMQDMLARNAVIATRAGFPPSPGFMGSFNKMFADPKGQYAASMLRDIERKGPVEADHIVGFMLDKARSFGLDDSLHQLAYLHLKAYEQRREAGRLT
jgi:2-dehydropantoate 2-reductase